MTKLIAAFFVALLALFTFSVFTVIAAYAGMRIERRRAKQAQQERLVKMVADARRRAQEKTTPTVPRPTPSAATRKAAQA